MALRNRIKRLEETSRKRGAAQLGGLHDPALERLVDHPEWPALVRELFAIVERLTEKGCADMVDVRQGVVADERGREVCCLLSEIAGGFEKP